MIAAGFTRQEGNVWNGYSGRKGPNGLPRGLAVDPLKRTPRVAGPDVHPPKEWSARALGWAFNLFNLAVDAMWTGPNFHGWGHPDPAEPRRALPANRDGVPLYSTKILALRALRNAVEDHAAEVLTEIDRQIRIEEKKARRKTETEALAASLKTQEPRPFCRTCGAERESAKDDDPRGPGTHCLCGTRWEEPDVRAFPKTQGPS